MALALALSLASGGREIASPAPSVAKSLCPALTSLGENFLASGAKPRVSATMAPRSKAAGWAPEFSDSGRSSSNSDTREDADPALGGGHQNFHRNFRSNAAGWAPAFPESGRSSRSSDTREDAEPAAESTVRMYCGTVSECAPLSAWWSTMHTTRAPSLLAIELSNWLWSVSTSSNASCAAAPTALPEDPPSASRHWPITASESSSQKRSSGGAPSPSSSNAQCLKSAAASWRNRNSARGNGITGTTKDPEDAACAAAWRQKATTMDETIVSRSPAMLPTTSVGRAWGAS
mmetsp:Transcript_32318/g.80459  ORF Transcript_32318/g.80459 Transcript_32318/m.80459 type:complete len:290 (+) Transcript_32318:792-1661(+)